MSALTKATSMLWMTNYIFGNDDTQHRGFCSVFVLLFSAWTVFHQQGVLEVSDCVFSSIGRRTSNHSTHRLASDGDLAFLTPMQMNVNRDHWASSL